MFRENPRSRTMGVQTIFCDESGFTGNNLTDESQPTFVYAAIAITDLEAAEIVSSSMKQMAVSSIELKASTLLRTARGRRVIADVMQRLISKSVVQVVDKRFALSCKFFEYVFEPALSSNSGFFYAKNFHNFVANLLYVSLVAQDVSAERAILGFQQFMRSRDDRDLKSFLGLELSTTGSAWRVMSDFASAYASDISSELDSLRANDGVGKWVLDLSSSSLFRVLAHLGDRFDELEVYCDDSKPIRAHKSMIDTMVGRRSESRWVIGDSDSAVTFNLVRPIQLVDSKKHPGIQVADLLASSVAYVFREPNHRESRIRELNLSQLDILPLAPDGDHIDLNKKEVVLNAMLLHELHDRALRASDPVDKIQYSYARFEAALEDELHQSEHLSSSARLAHARPPKVGANERCPCGSSVKYKKCCGRLVR